MKNTSAWAAAHAPAGTRWGKKALSLLLSLVLCLSLLPGMALADDDNTGSTAPKAIQLGTDGLQGPSTETTDKGTYYAPQSYVYFGVDGPNAIQWRVLDAKKANDDKTDGIFLLSENALIQTAFNAEYHQDGVVYHKGEAPSDGDHTACIPANQYQDSDAQQWCRDFVAGNDYTYTTAPLSAAERDAMLSVTKDDAAISGLFERNWGESSLKNDKLFFLSVQELFDHVGTYDTAPGMAVESKDYWWLRTPRADVNHSDQVGGINYDGLQFGGIRFFSVNSIRADAVASYKARPAFNLNTDKVLMISDCYTDSKTKGDVGQLTAVVDANNVMDGTTARVWKLTLKDSSRENFKAHLEAVSEDTLTFSYENAKTGENEYLSALVTDKNKTVKFYGHILKLDTDDKASGTASIKLPEDFDLAADHLFVYSEQCNDKQMTDYASELRELTLPDYAISASVTELDFGSVPTGFTAVPAAETVTITNTGTKAIEVPLPTSTDYKITAGDGFTEEDTATLAPSAKASFTVQPKTELAEGVHKETLPVTTDQDDAQCKIELSFARSNDQPTEYAQVTLENKLPSLGFQLLLNSDYEHIDAEDVGIIAPSEYGLYEYKLPENADGIKGTTNVVATGESVTILIPAGIYDHYLMDPSLRTSEGADAIYTTLRTNDDLFEAGKHYTITVLEKSEEPGAYTTRKTVETILPIYTVTAKGLYGGTMGITSGDPYIKSYVEGKKVGLQIGKRDGYTLESLTLEGITKVDWQAEGYEVETRGISFTMPANDVTITVNWVKNGSSSGGGSVSTYAVSVGKTEHGSVTVSPKSAAQGTTVTVTVAPDKGYALETLTVTDKDGKALTLTKKSDTQYSFSMPASNVTVTATFLEDNTMLNYFVDVKAGSYCYDAVLWAAEQGITLGTDAEHFSPSAPCTRAQIVTFLWRAAGSPASKATAMPFTDVRADSVYAKAILWAVEQGITLGTTETTFSPDAPCTRAQAVMFLFRYAAPEAVTLQELVSGYADAASVPGYALPAMNWALAAGILRGDGQKLMPGDTCTRGQIVTFLHRALAK